MDPVVLVGILCGCFTAGTLLVVLCLCCRSGVFRRCFGSHSVDKAVSPVVVLPDLRFTGSKKEYVQPRFEEGSLCVTPHPAVDVDNEEDSLDGKRKRRIGVDPDELRGRLDGITSPVSSGLLDFDLYYNNETEKLCGVIVQARELPMLRDRLPNTFVQVELSPGQGYVQRTPMMYESSNPRYDESFQFGPVHLDELLSQGQLHFRVYHSDYFRKEECLAWVDVPMSDFLFDDLAEGELHVCRALIKSETQTRLRLHQTSSMSRSSSAETPNTGTSKSKRGHQSPLHKSPLRHRCQSPQIYLTSTTGMRVMLEAEHVKRGAFSDSEIFTGSSRADPPMPWSAHAGSPGMLQLSLLYNRELGRLVVIILKAKDLQLRLNGEPPDVSVRLHVYNDIEQRKHSKKRTVIQRRTTDPVFNASFNLSLPDMALAHSQLVLSVVDVYGTGRLGVQVIGQLVLGREVSGERECKHWLDATSQDGGGRQVTMWHSLGPT